MAIVTTAASTCLRIGASEDMLLICSAGSRTLALAAMLPPATMRLNTTAPRRYHHNTEGMFVAEIF
jgi:hypothetical protein